MRALIADYAVILTIITFVAFDHYYGLATPKLIVPTIFKVGDISFVISIPDLSTISVVSKHYT